MVTAPAVHSIPVEEVAAGDFYTPPAPLPDVAAGSIVRSEPSRLAVSIPGAPQAVPASATRIMYRSSDTDGAPAAVVGTYLAPAAPWNGPGPRPLIAFAGGSKGQGDQCAPSKLLTTLIEYEPPLDVMVEFDVVALYSLLARGMAVVMTDYHGLGTPAVHDLLNRKAQAYALLDAARAARALPGNGLAPDAPVLLYGYSQGGSAAAAAAELRGSYAPELDVRGAYVGAPVVDAVSFIRYNDGRPHMAPTFAWMLNGIAADYPDTRPALDTALDGTATAILREAQGKCAVVDGLAQQHPNTTQWTAGGEPLATVIERTPVLAHAFGEQSIGHGAPSMPVLVASSRTDDGTPYDTVRAAVAQWCGTGASVELAADLDLPWIPAVGPTHVRAFFPALEKSAQWITDRLAGTPAPTNCAALP